MQTALRLGLRGTDVQILIRLLEERARWTVELVAAMPWVSDWCALRRHARKVLRRSGRVLEGIVRGSDRQTLWGLGRDYSGRPVERMVG